MWASAGGGGKERGWEGEEDQSRTKPPNTVWKGGREGCLGDVITTGVNLLRVHCAYLWNCHNEPLHCWKKMIIMRSKTGRGVLRASWCHHSTWTWQVSPCSSPRDNAAAPGWARQSGSVLRKGQPGGCPHSRSLVLQSPWRRCCYHYPVFKRKAKSHEGKWHSLLCTQTHVLWLDASCPP
jgi:hypothetical protein